jgi:hypothetical protein
VTLGARAGRQATAATGVTIGVLGREWRARVTPWGEVVPADGSPPLAWWVAASDRWHSPATEPAVRQRLLRDAPVVETALRVAGGDVVHRVYAVGDGGGLTVVEIENETALPVAVVFSRRDLLTARPTGAAPPVGGEVPDDGLVVPVGHRSRARVALPHDGRGGGALPGGLPSAEQVANGWVTQTTGAVRLDLPSGAPRVALTTLRAELLLAGPDPGDDAGLLVGIGELTRLREPATRWVDAVVDAAEALARRWRRQPELPWLVDAALASAAEVLSRAGERRAAGDLAATRRLLPPPEPTPAEPPEGVAGLAWAQRRVVVAGTGALDLFPDPFPPAWLGQPVEGHGLPAGSAVLGVALRWHGARPAVLWEADAAVRLTCSGLDAAWTGSGERGEALLSPPRPAPA